MATGKILGGRLHAGNSHVASAMLRRGSLLHKNLLTMAFSAMTSFLFAGTYYADASKADDSGDGLTPETAKKHIQAAVDLCASGSTVYVAEQADGERHLHP